MIVFPCWAEVEGHEEGSPYNEELTTTIIVVTSESGQSRLPTLMSLLTVEEVIVHRLLIYPLAVNSALWNVALVGAH